MTNHNLEELLAGKNAEQLRKMLLNISPILRDSLTNAIHGREVSYRSQASSYPARSQEFSDLLAKVKSFMQKYQEPLTRGGAPKTPEVLRHLLIDGYIWNEGAVGISLRESTGFHGGDVIAVREQVLIDPSDTSKPRSLGVMTYEGGNSMLHAYAIFSLNGNSMYNATTDDYALPQELKSATESTNVNKTPITMQQFLSDIYSHRDTLTLLELKPKVNLTSHLTRRKNTTSPALP